MSVTSRGRKPVDFFLFPLPFFLRLTTDHFACMAKSPSITKHRKILLALRWILMWFFFSRFKWENERRGLHFAIRPPKQQHFWVLAAFITPDYYHVLPREFVTIFASTISAGNSMRYAWMTLWFFHIIFIAVQHGIAFHPYQRQYADRARKISIMLLWTSQNERARPMTLKNFWVPVDTLRDRPVDK